MANHKTIWIPLLLLMTMISPVFASPSLTIYESNSIDSMSYQNTTSIDLNWGYVTGYMTDTKDLLTSPNHLGTSDLLTASLIIGSAINLYAHDDDNNKQRTWLQKFSFAPLLTNQNRGLLIMYRY